MDEQQRHDYLIGRIVRLSDCISPARYYSTMDYLRFPRTTDQLQSFCGVLEQEAQDGGINPGENFLMEMA